MIAWHWPPSELERLTLDELDMWAEIARADTEQEAQQAVALAALRR